MAPVMIALALLGEAIAAVNGSRGFGWRDRIRAQY
jgi:hypothetical protein